MEIYDNAVGVICIVVFLLAIIVGIVHTVCVKSPRYLWFWGCLLGFCFFTVFRHLTVVMAYDDPADPNYHIFKDWNVYRLILSDVLHLVCWGVVGTLSYFGFIRKKRILREVVLCGWIIFLAVLAGPVLAIAAWQILGPPFLQIGRVIRQLR